METTRIETGIDELMEGGPPKTAMTIVTGPSGIGKTTLGLLFMKEAAGANGRSVVFTFAEDVEMLIQREFKIGKYSVQMGRPLHNLRGLLQGTPEFCDDPDGISG